GIRGCHVTGVQTCALPIFTNGITPVASSGSDADAIRADVRALMAQFIAANNAPTSGVWIMSSTTALSLSLMVNALGQPEFPGLRPEERRVGQEWCTRGQPR